MRYPQSREQSAELLRLALARMGQHDAAFTPQNYTVWFEHAAGMNARLNQALEALLQRKPRLDNDDLHSLYLDHVAEIDPKLMQYMGSELQRMMSSLAQSAERTGGEAGAFGAGLESLASELLLLNEQRVSPSVHQAIEGSARMRRSAQALESEVRSSQKEIEQLQRELSRVRDESLRDTLTQVLNRKGFDQQLAQLLARAPQAGLQHALLMLDIDHFKQVNDRHGHVMGDRVLQATGEVLKACLPPGQGVTAARYGGEEFALLVPDTSPQRALELAETVRQRVKSMKVRDRRTQAVVLTITLSAGVAVLQPGEEASGATARADAALYQSKQAGRDRVTLAAAPNP